MRTMTSCLMVMKPALFCQEVFGSSMTQTPTHSTLAGLGTGRSEHSRTSSRDALLLQIATWVTKSRKLAPNMRGPGMKHGLVIVGIY